MTTKDFSCQLLECINALHIVDQKIEELCTETTLNSLKSADRSLGNILVAPFWDLSEKTSPEIAMRLALATFAQSITSMVQIRAAVIQADQKYYQGAHIPLIRSLFDVHGLTENCGVLGNALHNSGKPCDNTCAGTCLGNACILSGTKESELYRRVVAVALMIRRLARPTTLFKLMHSLDDTPDKAQPAEMASLMEVLLATIRGLESN